MIVDFLNENMMASSILIVGVLSIFLQWLMVLSLKGYVKASSNMKTTKKKALVNLKNQFEAIYDLNSQVKNIDVYVDKYLVKLRFFGITYNVWERVPYITAGTVTIITMCAFFYGYIHYFGEVYFAILSFAYGITLACLYVAFHIFSVKTRKQQIHLQLVDYLENYLSNRLLRDEPETECKERAQNDNAEEDMDMLKRLIKEMDSRKEKEEASGEVAVSVEDDSEVELLEEFVQSFLS
ncbi:MAG: DUF2207 domain-containing protein [Lachnospiraceae bacterium]|nr:DUF2207 domain-containing protein [Lachnospiraceae bacterium]